MQASVLRPINKALFSRLDGVIVVDGETIPYRDEVKDSTTPPFVTLGEYEETEAGAKNLESSDVVATLEIHSPIRGNRHIGEIASAILDVLGSGNLDLSADGLNVWDQEMVSMEVVKAVDAEGKPLRFGALKIRFRVAAV